jgi:hypothetical protein
VFDFPCWKQPNLATTHSPDYDMSRKPRARRSRSNPRTTLASKDPDYLLPWKRPLLGDDTLMWLGGCFVVFVLGITYMYGVLVASRASTLWEAVISLVIPFCGWLMFSKAKLSQAPRRQGELILIELLFDLIAVLAKLSSPRFGIWANYAFCAFFVGQTLGFLRSEEALIPSELRSVTLFLSICTQRMFMNHLASSSETATAIDASGRLIVFGEEAPDNVKLHYLFWLVGVLYVDYESSLPHSALHALHFASFCLAAFSGEFWCVALRCQPLCSRALTGSPAPQAREVADGLAPVCDRRHRVDPPRNFHPRGPALPHAHPPSAILSQLDSLGERAQLHGLLGVRLHVDYLWTG